jgi:hypothetical protein
MKSRQHNTLIEFTIPLDDDMSEHMGMNLYRMVPTHGASKEDKNWQHICLTFDTIYPPRLLGHRVSASILNSMLKIRGGGVMHRQDSA